MSDIDLDLPIGSIDGLAENYLGFYADGDSKVTYQVDLHRLVADCPDIPLNEFELTLRSRKDPQAKFLDEIETEESVKMLNDSLVYLKINQHILDFIRSEKDKLPKPTILEQMIMLKNNIDETQQSLKRYEHFKGKGIHKLLTQDMEKLTKELSDLSATEEGQLVKNSLDQLDIKKCASDLKQKFQLNKLYKEYIDTLYAISMNRRDYLNQPGVLEMICDKLDDELKSLREQSNYDKVTHDYYTDINTVLKMFYDPTKRACVSQEDAEIINKSDVMSEAIKCYAQMIIDNVANRIRMNLADTENESKASLLDSQMMPDDVYIRWIAQTLFTYYTNLIRDHLDSSNSSEFYKHLFKAFSTLGTFTKEHMC
jgi:hypothetical protein